VLRWWRRRAVGGGRGQCRWIWGLQPWLLGGLDGPEPRCSGFYSNAGQWQRSEGSGGMDSDPGVTAPEVCSLGLGAPMAMGELLWGSVNGEGGERAAGRSRGGGDRERNG
jgi:hypothetical protein